MQAECPKMARVFVTRELPFEALDRLRAAHDIDVWPEPVPPPPDALREHAARADGLLTMLTDRIDAALLDAAPGLRAIANLAVGTDNIDLAAAARRGVAVGNTPGVLTDATADLALALLLAITRRLPEGHARVREGRWGTWQPAEDLGTDLAGRTLGIVGFGRIGQAVGRRAEAFGMEVIQNSRSSGIALGELLERSDVVSLHTPFTPDTDHLIDAGALQQMKPTAYLVNTSRGGVVDQAALRAALMAGTIAGAALDVTDPEPLPADDPLLEAPNLLVVPHIGSATAGTRAKMAAMAVDNLLAALDGRPMPHPAS
jgi:glyoxylate reductase